MEPSAITHAQETESTSSTREFSTEYSPEPAVRLSSSEQLNDFVETLSKSYGILSRGKKHFAELDTGKNFTDMCQYQPLMPGQVGCAILVGTSIACLQKDSSLNKTGIHLQHLGYDTCVLTNPLRTEVLSYIISLCRNSISGRISTPIIIAFSGFGDEESLVFRDGHLYLSELFFILQCIPVEIPIMLLFDCVDSSALPDMKTLKDPFLGSQRDYSVYFLKRRDVDSTLFDHLQRQLLTFKSLASIVKSSYACFKYKPEKFGLKSIFDVINLRDLQKCLPGVPLCSCHHCDICKVFDQKCEAPHLNFTIPVIAPAFQCTLTPVSVDQRVLQYKMSEFLNLFDRYFSSLRNARSAELMLYTPDYYDGSHKLKEKLEQSPDVVMEFRRYVLENDLWIHDIDLERMKKVARAVKISEGEQIVEKMESLLVKLVNERIVQVYEAVEFPPYCHLQHMPQFVFVVDDEFSEVLFSESLFCALYYRIKSSIKSDGYMYIAFVTLQTANEKGLKVRPPS